MTLVLKWHVFRRVYRIQYILGYLIPAASRGCGNALFELPAVIRIVDEPYTGSFDIIEVVRVTILHHVSADFGHRRGIGNHGRLAVCEAFPNWQPPSFIETHRHGKEAVAIEIRQGGIIGAFDNLCPPPELARRRHKRVEVFIEPAASPGKHEFRQSAARLLAQPVPDSGKLPEVLAHLQSAHDQDIRCFGNGPDTIRHVYPFSEGGISVWKYDFLRGIRNEILCQWHDFHRLRRVLEL